MENTKNFRSDKIQDQTHMFDIINTNLSENQRTYG